MCAHSAKNNDKNIVHVDGKMYYNDYDVEKTHYN